MVEGIETIVAVVDGIGEIEMIITVAIEAATEDLHLLIIGGVDATIVLDLAHIHLVSTFK